MPHSVPDPELNRSDDMATKLRRSPRPWETLTADRLTAAEEARARTAVEASAAAPAGMTAAEIEAALAAAASLTDRAASFTDREAVFVRFTAGVPHYVGQRVTDAVAAVRRPLHPRLSLAHVLHAELTLLSCADWSRTVTESWAFYAKILAAVFGSDLRVGEEFRTSTVRRLADAIDQEQAWGDLPILADALQDAGLPDGPVTAYLRGPGPFFPGCRVLESCRGVW